MGDSIKILKAGNGDSLIIRFLGNDSKYKNVLIDGGNSKTDYKSSLKKEILKIQKEKENIDLLILTHTDQDHVKGIQFLLKDPDINKKIIKEIWFNSFDNATLINNNDISYIESCEIQNLIINYNIPRKNNLVIDDVSYIDFFGANISLLSPTKDDLNNLIFNNSKDIASTRSDYNFTISELINGNNKIFIDKKEDLDTSIENKASIAFLMEFNNTSILHLGDSNPNVVENSLRKILKVRNLEKIKVGIVKLSHHASYRCLSLSLIDIIDSNVYIVSTNGKKSNLPNKLTFAKILNRLHKAGEKDILIFNYDSVIQKLNFNDIDFKNYNFSCLNPNYEKGYIISL